MTVSWATLVLNQNVQREFTNPSKNTFLWSWAQHVFLKTYRNPEGSGRTGTRGKHTQFKPHWKAIWIHLTSPHGHMEMLSEKLSTQQQREDLLYLANKLSPQIRICCTKKPNQPQTAPSRLHLHWIFWNVQITAFCVFIFALLFWKFWCFCLTLLEVSH